MSTEDLRQITDALYYVAFVVKLLGILVLILMWLILGAVFLKK